MPVLRELILGVGGGIAAYKSCDLLRRLQDRGYQVTVVPTPASLNFVGSATWEALSGRPATSQVWERVEEVRHVSLAKQGEAILIAPATADLIARIAMGRADDLLTNLVLAVDVPIFIVPAMHQQMWLNPATQENVKTLRARGVIVMEPAVGALTSGDHGPGRFPETDAIIKEFEGALLAKEDFAGRTVIVTAGGTREAIDPVRFIGNKSSGRQGAAIAKAARNRGAEVKLILANSELSPAEIKMLAGIEIIAVGSALQMKSALEDLFPDCDLLVMSAAVADARPLNLATDKIRKSDLAKIDLVENPDLLKSLIPTRKSQVIVAFAAETKIDMVALRAKMASKGANILYINDVSDGAIFGSSQTQGLIIVDGGGEIPISSMSKEMLGEFLLDQALTQLG